MPRTIRWSTTVNDVMPAKSHMSHQHNKKTEKPYCLKCDVQELVDIVQ